MDEKIRENTGRENAQSHGEIKPRERASVKINSHPKLLSAHCILAIRVVICKRNVGIASTERQTLRAAGSRPLACDPQPPFHRVRIFRSAPPNVNCWRLDHDHVDVFRHLQQPTFHHTLADCAVVLYRDHLNQFSAARNRASDRS